MPPSQVYQGELDVTSQIDLGGKGQYAGGYDATQNFDTGPEAPKNTFEDIDGLEVLAGPGGKLYAIIQEDSGNDYGERMFITPLEHEDDGKELTYFFIAMSGGELNTRMLAGVGIPAGTNCEASSHEFSGIFDASAFFHKDDAGDWTMSASDTGAVKRAADAEVAINDKSIIIGLQAHSLHCGVISAFQADRYVLFVVQHRKVSNASLN